MSMPDLLDDKQNLLMLENIVSGEAVSANLSLLSKRLKRHRNTIRDRVADLFKYKIIDRPVFPFLGLYREYPLLITVRADLPDDKMVEDWVKDDKNIFAAYRIRQGEYNVLLFVFHKDVLSYQLWRESLVPEGKIPPRDVRHPSTPTYYSNQLMVKYEPSAPIRLMEEEFLKQGKLEINGYVLDDLAFQIMKCLVNRIGIKINEYQICRKLKMHRKTVVKRISQLLESGWIGEPVCRFPHFFVPPNYLLVLSVYEIKKSKDEVLDQIKKDSHVTIALNISHGRYNLLLLEVHKTIKDHLEWEREYSRRFPACFGSGDVMYLSPEMTISIDQQKVSLGIIKSRLAQVHGNESIK